MPNFIDLDALPVEALQRILQEAKRVKALTLQEEAYQPLLGKHLAMVFEKPSTRTRVSFEVGINQLGGRAVLLETGNSQIGRGESVEDTARVLSRFVDIIMMRCFNHQMLEALGEHATVPVINGLSDDSHPCQIMADVMTYQEHRGDLAGRKIAWVGDCNNVTYSWIQAAHLFGAELYVASPKSYGPNQKMQRWIAEHQASVAFGEDPVEAVKEADLVITDCWASMGDSDVKERMQQLAPYQVNAALMAHAAQDALFMHCLPAHRGEEVTDEVIDGPHSVVFDEAENRLHVQKAIILWCLGWIKKTP